MSNPSESATLIGGVLGNLPGDERARFLESLADATRVAVEKAIPRAFDEAARKLGYTEEVAGLVHLLASRSNDSKEAVLKKALTLYSTALDYSEKGDRLAILSPEDEIVREIIGVGTSDPPAMTLAQP